MAGAKLPQIPEIAGEIPPALIPILQAMKEILEVRSGQRNAADSDKFATSDEVSTGVATAADAASAAAAAAAAAAVAGIGYGQTWQNMTASRALTTTYTNDTAKPIQVSVSGSGGGGFVTFNATIKVGVSTADIQVGKSGQDYNGSTGNSGHVTVAAIVPPGHKYEVTGVNFTIGVWAELRQ